jgi:hypothetical protein
MRNLKYPWKVYFKKRKLAPQDRWLLGSANAYVDELIADKGGPEKITVAERRIVETCSAARVAWLRAWLDEDKKAVALFMQIEQRGLKRLVLSAEPRPSTTT